MISIGRLRMEKAWRKLGLTFSTAALVLAGWAAGMDQVQARGSRPSSQTESVGVVHRAELPAEARETERLILAGGPFPYGKDGVVFGNRERMLPRQPRGYYREYTVRSPGARDRGARRIVCGGPQAREPEACFYTEDHYASFRRIVQ